MIEREILLNSATAILLACLLWHHGAISRRYGRTGFILVVMGSLIPLLDPAVYHVLAEDRIDFLTRPPRFAAPMFGVLLIVAVGVLAAFVTAARRAAHLALGLTAGYGCDALARLSGRRFPVSAIRIRKFCADTVIDTRRLEESGFVRPYSLERGLRRMITADFLKRN